METFKKRKRGEVREGGKVFWQYCEGREYWVEPEHADRLRQLSKERAVKFAAKHPGYSTKLSKKRYYADVDKSRQQSRDWQDANRDKARESSRLSAARWRKENPEAARERVNRWRKANIDKVRQRDREYYLKRCDAVKAYGRKYAKANRKIITEKKREYDKKRRRDNPIFALSASLRTRLNNFLKQRHITKPSSSQKLIGCSWDFFKSYIEAQFQPGMTWENRGRYGWHIDHKIPLASAKSEEEIQKLCHYTNLQPLWAKENLQKSSKLS